MRFFNWAEAFKETPTYDANIPDKVRNLETGYWIWMLLSVIFLILGIAIVIGAPANNLKLLLIGLFLALDGCINVAIIKIWAHIRLAFYWNIWDRQNRIESEIKKLEAEDL